MLNVSFCWDISGFSVSRRSFLKCSRALNICLRINFLLLPLSISQFSKSLQHLSKSALLRQILLSFKAWLFSNGKDEKRVNLHTDKYLKVKKKICPKFHSYKFYIKVKKLTSSLEYWTVNFILGFYCGINIYIYRIWHSIFYMIFLHGLYQKLVLKYKEG